MYCRYGLESHLKQSHVQLQIKLHWVGMIAQLLLEEVDHARSLVLLVGTIAKYASQSLKSGECVGSYWTDCITVNVIFDS